MALTLRVISRQHQTLGKNARKVFDKQCGTIGRAEGNAWVLPDPERLLSSQHAVITYEAGVYYLSDTSTNGVYVKGSEQPVGKRGRVKLKDGDRLHLGDFDLLVSINAVEGDDDAVPLPVADSGLYGAEGLGSANALSMSLDPLELLDRLEMGKSTRDNSRWRPSPLSSPPAQRGAEHDDVPVTSESLQTPTPVEGPILQDWNATDVAEALSGEPPPVFAPIPEHALDKSTNLGPVSGHAQPPPFPEPSMATKASCRGAEISVREPTRPGQPLTAPREERLLMAFWQGAGLDQAAVTTESPEEFMGLVGRLVRQMVQGLMEALIARTSVKNDYRMGLTMIQPIENNPLKFSVGGVDEAMRTVLCSHKAGYLPGIQAVQEGFQDLQNHQIAMIAGMQAKFQALLERLDPKALEGQFDKDLSGRLLLAVQRKARYWDAYSSFFSQEVKKRTEDDFLNLFDEEIARAYEQQISELAKARNKAAD